MPSQRDPQLPPGAPHCRPIGSSYVAGALETVETRHFRFEPRDLSG
jgi:hypothetical protein